MRQSRKVFTVLVIAVLALLVVAPTVASAAPVSSAGAAPSAWGHVGCWYRVHRGDTLSRIAFRYGVSTGFMQMMNGVRHPDRIYAGTWMRVPCGFAHAAYPHNFKSGKYGTYYHNYYYMRKGYYGPSYCRCGGYGW